MLREHLRTEIKTFTFVLKKKREREGEKKDTHTHLQHVTEHKAAAVSPAVLVDLLGKRLTFPPLGNVSHIKVIWTDNVGHHHPHGDCKETHN